MNLAGAQALIARARVVDWAAARAFGALLVGGAALILWLGRGLSFFADEWAFIEQRSLGDPSGWFKPHNEHWSTLPVVAYRTLVETVGLGSYVPYLGLVLLLHLVVAALVYRLVRRRAGAVPALGAGTIMLFFGSGFENLFWGFQIGFVGGTAAGLATFDVLDGLPTPRRAAALIVLLAIGLMTSGIGLVFLAAAIVEVALRPIWRRWWPLLGIPIAMYLLWYVVVGQTGIYAHRDPFSIASMLWIPYFVINGFGVAAGTVTGLGPVWGLLPAVAVAAGALWLVRHGRPIAPRFLAAVTAIVVGYALIGVTRAGVTLEQVHYSRYMYVTGALALVGV